MSMFHEELEKLLNSHSMENNSNTPDFILATYLMECLAAFDRAVMRRATWYGGERAIVDPVLSGAVSPTLEQPPPISPTRRIAELEWAIDSALAELGVPDDQYPAPIANAYNILSSICGEGSL